MSVSLPFRLLRKFLGPKWLTTEGDGELIGYSLDLMRDAFVERLRLGHLARFPQNGPNGETAPPDALAAIGRDRRVIRGLSETDQGYALRLLAWLDDRKTGGNPFALLQKLAEYVGTDAGFVFKTVDVNGNWFVRAADGTRTVYLRQGNWDWDGDFTGLKWARYWVVIHPGPAWTVGDNYGDAGIKWGERPGTWGSNVSAGEVQTIRAIVGDWNAGHAHCINIIVAFDPTSFDPTAALHGTGLPDGLWEHWSKNVGGVQVPARLATARYWDGV